MKIVLISIYDTIDSAGIRLLSSYLKSKGHEVKIIFTPSSVEASKIDYKHGDITEAADLQMKFSKSLVKKIFELSKDADAIGIGLFTTYFIKAKNLTLELRKIMKKNKRNIPIIWGGIHPTIFPKECLDYADYVIVGDGEETTHELLEYFDATKNIDLKNIDGLCYIRRGKAVFNAPRKNNENLDEYPFQDYDLKDHYVLKSNEFLQMTPELLFEYQHDMYVILITRGCPHSCTYCGNNALRKVSCGKYNRFRSVDNVIAELRYAIKKFPFIKKIAIQDDVFFIRPYDYISDFAKKYKKYIKYPLYGNISPLTVNEDKIKVMIDAGMKTITMGVQSGSDRINLQIFKRMTPRKRILDAMAILGKYAKKGKLSVGYQFIIDVPYETNQDIRDTADLLLKIPKPYTAGFYPLIFYPGTELYDKGKADGKIREGINDHNQSYWEFERTKYFSFATYAMLIVYFSQSWFKGKLSKFLYRILMNNFTLTIFGNKLVTYSIYYIGYAYRKLFRKGFGVEIN